MKNQSNLIKDEDNKNKLQKEKLDFLISFLHFQLLLTTFMLQLYLFIKAKQTSFVFV